jgi:cystathionine beta-lyase
MDEPAASEPTEKEITMTSAEPMNVLRRRTSEKWGGYGKDVLPMFVAEMDFGLAPAIKSAIHEAVEVGDK